MASRTWPQLPLPLPTSVVDNHTHLDEEADDHHERLAQAASVGVDRIVTIGCNIEAARWTVAHGVTYRGVVGGVAIHPNDAARVVASEGQARLVAQIAEIGELARHERIRVISETGLDYYRTRDEAGVAVQKWAFREHIALAKELGLPMQIHCRDAHEDVVDILVRDGAPPATIFHCFSADAEFAQLAAARGWYCSFAGTVTFRSNEGLRAAAKIVPASLLLVETDAPYLTPVPCRGKTNASYVMPHTVRALAEIREIPLAEFCEQISRVSEGLYGPW